MDKSYFQALNIAIKNHERAIPFLLVDLDRIDENITVFQANKNPNTALRIPVKSLPSFPLIHYLMKELRTDKLMVFHQPFLTDLSPLLDQKADVLFGKPMPIQNAAYYYDHLPKLQNNFDPFRQVQWLIDTVARLEEYIGLAQRLDKRLRINLEIDVGLHRGGFKNLETLRKALTLLNTHKVVAEFSGFMGYEPHIVKIPKFVKSQVKLQRESNRFYNECKEIVQKEFPLLWNDTLTFNGAGSPTVNLHKTDASPLNDITAGSCFVKPTTFDIPTLQEYKPACYIATPVLKKFEGTTLPGLRKMKKYLQLNTWYAQSFFIYGGFWKADYHYPNVRQNSIFGASTNQTMLNAKPNVDLDIGDFVFLRPHQSEFVFLQFGDILTLRNREISEAWNVLTYR